MKKWLTLFLLLITLAGTFYPCCLSDECSEEEMIATHPEGDQQPDGVCSPFFACSSCPGFAQMSKPVQIIQPVKDNQVYHEAVVIFNLSSYASSFWQPPRVA